MTPCTAGQRYLVSMLGEESEWVHNVRAAGGCAFVKRGRARPVLMTQIPPDKRALILKAWCQVAPSGRRHLQFRTTVHGKLMAGLRRRKTA